MSGEKPRGRATTLSFTTGMGTVSPPKKEKSSLSNYETKNEGKPLDKSESKRKKLTIGGRSNSFWDDLARPFRSTPKEKEEKIEKANKSLHHQTLESIHSPSSGARESSLLSSREKEMVKNRSSIIKFAERILPSSSSSAPNDVVRVENNVNILPNTSFSTPTSPSNSNPTSPRIPLVKKNSSILKNSSESREGRHLDAARRSSSSSDFQYPLPPSSPKIKEFSSFTYSEKNESTEEKNIYEEKLKEMEKKMEELREELEKEKKSSEDLRSYVRMQNEIMKELKDESAKLKKENDEMKPLTNSPSALKAFPRSNSARLSQRSLQRVGSSKEVQRLHALITHSKHVQSESSDEEDIDLVDNIINGEELIDESMPNSPSKEEEEEEENESELLTSPSFPLETEKKKVEIPLLVVPPNSYSAYPTPSNEEKEEEKVLSTSSSRESKESDRISETSNKLEREMDKNASQKSDVSDASSEGLNPSSRSISTSSPNSSKSLNVAEIAVGNDKPLESPRGESERVFQTQLRKVMGKMSRLGSSRGSMDMGGPTLPTSPSLYNNNNSVGNNPVAQNDPKNAPNVDWGAHSFLSDIAYSLTRGEQKAVQRKLLKLLSKSSSRNALFQARDKYGQSILHLLTDGAPDLIETLLDKKGDTSGLLDVKDMRGWSPLTYAAMKGDEVVLTLLLSKGALPDQLVLHYFCSHFCSNNMENILMTMMARGVDLNEAPPGIETGDRPLHAAIANSRENGPFGMNGATSMVEILLKHGALPNLTNAKGDSPLHWAVYTNKSRVAKLLCMRSADLELKGSEGLGAVSLAKKTNPTSEVCACLQRIEEILTILQPLGLNEDEKILVKMIEEEIGLKEFKDLTLDIIKAMGIRHAGTIALLLSAQEKLKEKSRAENSANVLNENKQRDLDIGTKSVDSSLGFEVWASGLHNGSEMKQNHRVYEAMVKEDLENESERLNDRIQFLSFRSRNSENPNKVDSNFFHAASDQLFDSTEKANDIRQKCVNWLVEFGQTALLSKTLTPLVSLVKSSSWEEYCKEMKKDAWGDALCVYALCQSYQCQVVIVTSTPGEQYMVNLSPSENAGGRTVILSHSQGRFWFTSLNRIAENPMVQEWGDSIDFRELKLIKNVGQGGGGKVYEGSWKGLRVAIKKVNHFKEKEGGNPYNRDANNQARMNEESESLKRFRQEIAILKKLRFPNVIMYMGTSVHGTNVYIVTEFMERGSLKSVLKNQVGRLSWATRIKMAVEIAAGMNYLHSLKPLVVHRDLKSSNVLVDANYGVKLSDFGVAKILDNQEMLKTYCSTLAWTAPEILNAENYDEKIDVYSFGVVMWELATFKVPYEGMSEQEILMGVSSHNLRPPTNTEEFPSEYLNVMTKCWSTLAKNRPNFEWITEELRRMSETTVQMGTTSAPSNEVAVLSSVLPPAFADKKIIEDSSIYWQIESEELEYDPKNMIGSGASANVYRGKYRQQDVAIKILKTVPNEEDLIEIQKELEVLSRLRTPNLVFFYGASLGEQCCIVTEYISGGTLHDVLNKEGIQFGWAEVINYSLKLAKGLHFLHSWKPPVLHRDLKPTNLLVDGENIRICDLGLARFTTQGNKDITLFKCKGTPLYIAPEVYHSGIEIENMTQKDVGNFTQTGYSTKSDVFSFAIILWEMVARCVSGEYKTPYYSDNKTLQYDAAVLIQVAKKNLRPLIRPETPTDFATLLQWCWNKSPDLRPTTLTIVKQLEQIQEDFNTNKTKWAKIAAATQQSQMAHSVSTASSPNKKVVPALKKV
eukprot:TRINITY_DN2234_c0_g1_i2.p1 TRINITY_DN2234_c0_g1~~TRINITY_DN2234_c0_g1_i2.p1  ORF type:complete len:1771 (+),score=730.99 TRINITY_DN2234_c0_g1_i2:165-5477(+)